LFDAFNIAKSIWNMAYDHIDIYLKKNKRTLVAGSGYIFFYKKSDDKLFLWEYQIKKPKGENHSDKTYLNLIYEGPLTNSGITETIDLFSTWNETDYYKELPIFEVKTQQDFPMDQTLVPIMKRKVMAYIFQVVNIEKINNFDSEA
jgi:hypothetical protein